MAEKTEKRQKLPSDKKIIEGKAELAAYLKKVVSGEVSVRSKKETVASKLELLQDVLSPLKDEGIPYATLCTILEEKIDLRVSPQTLRAFCQNRLGFPKAESRGKKGG